MAVATSLDEYDLSVGTMRSLYNPVFQAGVRERYAASPDYTPLTRKDILRIIDLADKYKRAKDEKKRTCEPFGPGNGYFYELRLKGAWESWDKSAAEHLRSGLYHCFPECFLDNYVPESVSVYVRCEDYGVDWELIQFLKDTRLPISPGGG